MEILQPDSKTIRITKNGFTFFLRYYFLWDKTMRVPESVVLEQTNIRAFFLTSVIKDTITEDETGLYIIRDWNIVPSGEISLFFTLDLVAGKNVPFLFPCSVTDDRIPREQVMLFGERLSFPSSVFLFPENKGMFISLDAAEKKEDQGSVGVSLISNDGVSCVRTEIAFPPKEALTPDLRSIPGYVSGMSDSVYTSSGNLRKKMKLNVLMCPENEIFPLATSFFLQKTKANEPDSPTCSKVTALKLIKEGINTCLNDLLVDNSGVYGPLTSEKTQSISSLVCAGLSNLIQGIFENNFDMNEVSFKLGDFCLKSQHPNGMFLQTYRIPTKTWENNGFEKSVKDENGAAQPFLVPLAYSAIVADYLISTALILDSRGLSGEKYFSAGKRYIELFFDSKKKGIIDIGSLFVLDTLDPKEKAINCLELIHPLIKLYTTTNEDKYKKAVVAIKNEFFTDSIRSALLPAPIEGDSPDFESALLLLKTAVTLEGISVSVKDRNTFINAVLPWVYFNKPAIESPQDLRPFAGGVIDSFDRCRIVYRGFELAYYLLKMSEMIDGKLVKVTKSLASYLIDSESRLALGIPWFHHTLYNNEPREKNGKPVIGTFNSESFVREAGYLLRIVNQFPDIIK